MNELEVAFLELIENYLKSVADVAQIFKEEFNVEINDLRRARIDKTIPFRGSIPHRGITEYFYHGIGLFVKFCGKNIDFDFYFDKNDSKINGFDSQRLAFFAGNNKIKYSDFLQENIIEKILNDLAAKNIIVKPKDEHSFLWILNTPQ